MHDLTPRQIQILKSLIDEYIKSAEPVGSETLEKKHNLSASPATIRNEMVRLTELGYLKKPHTSAGRTPTSTGIRFYVKQLMKEKELSLAEEVAVKEKLWDYRNTFQKLMHEITKSLAEKTGVLAVVNTNQGDFYCAGYARILDLPEFFDIDVTRSLLSIIDEYEYFDNICENMVNDEEVHVLLGEDLGPKLNGPYGFVVTHFDTPKELKGEIGVLGPVRLNYNEIVPTVRYYGSLLEEIAKEWH